MIWGECERPPNRCTGPWPWIRGARTHPPRRGRALDATRRAVGRSSRRAVARPEPRPRRSEVPAAAGLLETPGPPRRSGVLARPSPCGRSRGHTDLVAIAQSTKHRLNLPLSGHGNDSTALRVGLKWGQLVGQPRAPADQLTGCPCGIRARIDGAGAGIRTLTPLRAAEFKSAASAIPPLRLNRKGSGGRGIQRPRQVLPGGVLVDGAEVSGSCTGSGPSR